ncbi:MAG: hypothetical protein ABSA10_00635 [Anaerolineales bacterium]
MSTIDYSTILNEHRFLQAITNVNRRAEKQTDQSKLVEIFVETDLPTRCETTEHQIILGRRGTGKTHLMKYFQYQMQSKGYVIYFTDCTRLGSGIPSASDDPIVIASKFFSSLLNDLGTFLLDHAIRLESITREKEERILNSLSTGLAAYMTPSANEGESIYNYRQISSTTKSLLEDLEIGRLFVVIDEWAQIPLNAQPYLAEFIKRALLTVPTISLKLLAVNYQCKFSTSIAGNIIGMQRGADFTDVIDIDQYLIFEENRSLVTDFFGQLLYNHLGAELDWNLKLSSEEKAKSIKRIFTQEPDFVELVRADEGNCRDFICIFSKAYIEGFRRNTDAKSISIPHIQSAASSWYTNEKESNIKTEKDVRETISFLLDKVLKDYRSRTFMVETGQEEHPRLLRLLNERILHRLNIKYSHPDRPGLRYELYSLDYGAYITYRGTVNEPRQEIFFTRKDVALLPEDERKGIVPFDDRRSIRRIVFNPNELSIET